MWCAARADAASKQAATRITTNTDSFMFTLQAGLVREQSPTFHASFANPLPTQHPEVPPRLTDSARDEGTNHGRGAVRENGC